LDGVLPHASPPNAGWMNLIRGQGGSGPSKDLMCQMALKIFNIKIYKLFLSNPEIFRKGWPR
jgi:hypothetical protein